MKYYQYLKIVDNYLHNKKSEDDLFKPYWNGFDGEVNYLGDNKWQIKGKIELNGKKLLIKEIPISWSLPKYKEKLNKSKEKCFIEKYTDPPAVAQKRGSRGMLFFDLYQIKPSSWCGAYPLS